MADAWEFRPDMTFPFWPPKLTKGWGFLFMATLGRFRAASRHRSQKKIFAGLSDGHFRQIFDFEDLTFNNLDLAFTPCLALAAAWRWQPMAVRHRFNAFGI
jgi:hypothetical protein